MGEDIKQKITDSLIKSGLPLEYYTYTEYRKHKFSGFQSDFINDGDLLREIDVCAHVNFNFDVSTTRLSNVVECKWSKDKPWVIYTSTPKKAPAATITQSIGNEIATTLLWMAAGENILHNLDLFHPNRRFGFSGNRLDESDNKRNQIYEAVQSLVTKAVRVSEKYNSYNLGPDPYKHISLTFPTIVVDGQLFEAFYNEGNELIEIEEVKKSILHWKGSKEWPWGVRIDIVTKKHLSEYCKNLRAEFEILYPVLEGCLKRYRQFLQTKNFDDLEIKPASRGILGTPRLLRP